ncbi:type II toxin-antitoxin system RelE/ParE family toxin [Methylopila sp. M107]|uniref:type II toxin-antitoxin system RelE/ParE family toxin n=1 Tax=Methylopila sp. M107 TaxID=1101190 RepID=UPI00037252A4|nr:type II toxin-antitoxin system RelE/ParE family toxin [Methylopila sp. M107]
MRPIYVDPVANRDAAEIFEWIAQDNVTTARSVIDRIEETIRGLAEFSTGRPGRLPGTFEMVVTGLPYIIVYAVRRYRGREAIVVLYIQHGARQFPRS